MNKLSIIVLLCVVGAAGTAVADRYELLELGDSPVTYIEHRASVNDSSQVAWTVLYPEPSPGNPNPSPRFPRAYLTTAGSIPLPSGATKDLHSLLTSFGGSYATDFISRSEDLNNSGDVVGYATDTPLEFRRHAAMWFENGGVHQVVDLHAALVTNDPDGAGTYDITAAYGISERVGGFIFAAGYRRSSLAVMSTPTVWKVNASTGVVVAIFTLNPTPPGGPGAGSGYNYGLAYDVAARLVGSNIELAVGGGVGGQQAGGILGGAYLYAYYFRVNGGSGTITQQRFVPNVSPLTHATSGINRVDLFDLDGPGGNPADFYVAGYAVLANGRSEAFSWKDGASAADVGGRLASGDISIGMGLTMRTDDGAVPNQPQVIGSSTIGAGVVGTANGSTPLRGFYSYVEPEANLGRMCNLNDEFPGAMASIEAATDMNDSGVVVGWSGTRAVIGRPEHGDSPELKFYKRINSGNDAVDFWWMEMDGVLRNSGGNAGQVLFADEPGCYSMSSYCDGGNLSLNTPVGPLGPGISVTNNRVDKLYALALDNSMFPTGYPGSAAVVALSTNAHWFNTAWNGFEPNRFDPAPTGYAQGYAIDKDGICQVSDVYDMSDPNLFELNPCNEHTDGFWSPRGVYRNCVTDVNGNDATMNCETDITISNTHCGACNLAVNDNLSCTTDDCVSGTKVNSLNAGNCLIGGTCQADNDRNSWTYSRATHTSSFCNTSVSNVTSPNPCQICDSSSSTSNWTNPGAATCCVGGVPRLDSYDTANTQIDCNSTLGTDRNDGRSQAARWLDPRGFSGRYQANHDWNTGSTCRVGTGTGDVRKIDAHFTPYVDTVDWYETRFDDDVNNRTPEPRARLISRDGQSMRLCLFVDCVDANENNNDLKSWAYRGGSAGNTVCEENGGACRRGGASPARDARGICRTTDGNGVADIEIYDYDCLSTTNEDAYVFVEVTALGNINSKTCDQMDYTLYYGNDSEGNGNSSAGGAGCDTCCN